MLFEGEHFESIPGFDGYHISRSGKILSTKRNRTRLIKPKRTRTNQVALYTDGFRQSYTIETIKNFVFNNGLNPKQTKNYEQEYDADDIFHGGILLRKLPFGKNYWLSKNGLIFSITKYNIKQLAIQKNQSGYLVVDLSCAGRAKRFFVHRLAAETFLPNPYNLPQVNHIDSNRLNNSIDNLEWVTQRQNLVHGQMALKKNGNLPVGVRKVYRKFHAFIRVEGKNRYLGTYKTAEEAGNAYMVAKNRCDQIEMSAYADEELK